MGTTYHVAAGRVDWRGATRLLVKIIFIRRTWIFLVTVHCIRCSALPELR